MAITQSSTVSRQVAQAYPDLPEVMIPHPTYENFGDRVDREEARRKLDLESRPTLLFFGFVREYKGLDILLEALPAIVSQIPDVQLLVVGEFFGDAEKYHAIVRNHRLESVVHFHSEYVPNSEVANWFSAADLLVMPYRSATNSGIVQIAYNFTLPSVVTDVGSLSEVVTDGETGYVISDSSPETLADAVKRGLEPETLRRMESNIERASDRFSWDSFARTFENFVFRE
jgi:glycosyltransferase involved in cell wall biosynthesis